mmetsp:Transcript_19291/g.32228  ORF Transcript_19291/g.32228 Transcript_19291/m.32228 type:complete len:229 (-) Transcript_19291:1151-1837(-)
MTPALPALVDVLLFDAELATVVVFFLLVPDFLLFPPPPRASISASRLSKLPPFFFFLLSTFLVVLFVLDPTPGTEALLAAVFPDTEPTMQVSNLRARADFAHAALATCFVKLGLHVTEQSRDKARIYSFAKEGCNKTPSRSESTTRGLSSFRFPTSTQWTIDTSACPRTPAFPSDLANSERISMANSAIASLSFSMKLGASWVSPQPPMFFFSIHDVNISIALTTDAL